MATAFPDFPNHDKIEITGCMWLDNAPCRDVIGQIALVTTWAYCLKGIGIAIEAHLRKLPPDPESWERCEFNANNIEILEKA